MGFCHRWQDALLTGPTRGASVTVILTPAGIAALLKDVYGRSILPVGPLSKPAAFSAKVGCCRAWQPAAWGWVWCSGRRLTRTGLAHSDAKLRTHCLPVVPPSCSSSPVVPCAVFHSLQVGSLLPSSSCDISPSPSPPGTGKFSDAKLSMVV